MTFSRTLRKWMQNHGIKTEQAAKMIGVSGATISGWLRGQYKPTKFNKRYALEIITKYDEESKAVSYKGGAGTMVAGAAGGGGTGGAGGSGDPSKTKTVAHNVEISASGFGGGGGTGGFTPTPKLKVVLEIENMQEVMKLVKTYGQVKVIDNGQAYTFKKAL